MKQKVFRRISSNWLISFKSTYKVVWDYLVLILAIYNSLMIPFEQAFPNDYTKSTFSEYLDMAIDIVFVIDIGLMFFTTRLNKKGKEVRVVHEIAKLYTSTRRFYFDSLSILGTKFFAR